MEEVKMEIQTPEFKSWFAGSENHAVRLNQPHELTKAEWQEKTIPSDLATTIVSKHRAGSALSKNKGKEGGEPTAEPLIEVKLSPSYFLPRYIEMLKETTDPARVETYTNTKIITPIYACISGRGNLVISDGGHRLLATINRRDEAIPALVPASAHEFLIEKAIEQNFPVSPEILSEHPFLNPEKVQENYKKTLNYETRIQSIKTVEPNPNPKRKDTNPTREYQNQINKLVLNGPHHFSDEADSIVIKNMFIQGYTTSSIEKAISTASPEVAIFGKDHIKPLIAKIAKDPETKRALRNNAMQR